MRNGRDGWHLRASWPAAVLGAVAAVLAALLALGCGAARAGKPLALGARATVPRSTSSHVVVVGMENAEYGEVIGSSQAP
jgi:anti-sigma-K factor RskA